MNQMVILSTLGHIFFFGFLSLILILNQPQKASYKFVQMVDLVNLPPAKTAPRPTKQIKKASRQVKKINKIPKIKSTPEKKVAKALKKKSETIKKAPPLKPLIKSKPIKLLAKKNKSIVLAKLQTMERDIVKDTPVEKRNKLEEKDIAEMLASLDKINKTKMENKLFVDREDTKDAIWDKLSKLEEATQEKDSLLDIEKPEKSKSLKKLEEIEKRWKDEALITEQKKEGHLNAQRDERRVNKALEELSRYSSLSNKNLNNSPSYLSAYFAIIKNKANEKWKNPSGAEILSETETNKKTIISFNILRSGVIERYKIDQSSGNHTLDNLALAAVKNSNPLPPLPLEYRELYLRVFIDFNYALK